MNPVAIAASDPLGNKAPFDDLNFDIWAFNGWARNSTPRLSAAFQMHRPGGYLCHGQGYLDWLRNLEVPVYMRQKRAEFPTSIAYPFEEVFEMTKNVRQGFKGLEGLRWLTSSISMAIALAVLQERPRIDVYGVEMQETTEYKKQRECYTFWTGFAGGRGIELNIYCGNNIFRKEIYE